MSAEPIDLNGESALETLRRYLQPRQADRPRCELCSATLAVEHSHLIEIASRRLCCACEACAILFGSAGAAKYRRVPRRVELWSDFKLSDVQWEGLQLPINLAFFVQSTPTGRVVALYPSPGGATEALPPPDAWAALMDDNPGLGKLEPDVEALLVNRLGPEPAHYIVGIDECYALVGLVRTHWRGLSGGAVWVEIKRFFDDLKRRSSAPGAAVHV